ncbi:thioredoxin family protein [Candidatus Woesearchaeota archaeon]|nr:thioredoxin family protein [Candidatus Woesearchaeota archaeon]
MPILNVTPENYQREVVESNIPVVMDFYGDWCDPCKRMAPLFEKISDEYADRLLKFARVDVAQNPDVVQQFGVQSVPCFVIAYHGREIGRTAGIQTQQLLEERIEQALRSRIP